MHKAISQTAALPPGEKWVCLTLEFGVVVWLLLEIRRWLCALGGLPSRFQRLFKTKIDTNTLGAAPFSCRRDGSTRQRLSVPPATSCWMFGPLLICHIPKISTPGAIGYGVILLSDCHHHWALLQAAFLQPGKLLSPQSLTFGLFKRLKCLESKCLKSNTAGWEFVPVVFGKAPRGVHGCRDIWSGSSANTDSRSSALLLHP